MDINKIREKFKFNKNNLPKSQLQLRDFSKIFSKVVSDIKDEKVIAFSKIGKDIRKSLAAFQSGKPNWFNKSFQKNPRLWKLGAIAGAGIVAASLLRNVTNHELFNWNKPSIPKEYERGYDLINEQFSDFGSPVKLAKTASKVLTPYHSSMRRAVRTTIRTMTDRNIALKSHKNAIGHSRY